MNKNLKSSTDEREISVSFQWPKIMALLLLIALVVFQSMAEITLSQSVNVKLILKDVTVEDVIEELHKQTGYEFSYDEEIPGKKMSTVSVNVNNENIESVLEQVFHDSNTSFKVLNNRVFLKSNKNDQADKIWETEKIKQQSDITVRGKVVDSNGETIIGATIVVKDDASKGTVTDIDGNYTLPDVSPNAVLQISYVGMVTREVQVDAQTQINITLTEDSELLDEVVVVAFGTVKKEAFTGSAGTLKTDDIIKSQQTNAAQSLAGRVAGVQISNATGEMGGEPTIKVRGVGSINAGNEPLFIVDGMPYDGDIGSLNPADIESMTVLKDAASNALYGARGANGVIMITTKRAEYNTTNVSLDAKWGINQSAKKKYDVITDPGEYYEVYYKARYNRYIADGETTADANSMANADIMNTQSGNGPGYLVFSVPTGENLIGIDGRLNSNATPGNLFTDVSNGNKYWLQADDWENIALQNGIRQEYNATFSTGTQNSNTFFSLGHLTSEGITNGSDMRRITGRLKSDFNVKDWLAVGGNVSFTNYKYNKLTFGEDVIGSGNIWSIIYGQAPIYPVYLRDENGTIMTDEQGRTQYDFADSRTGINGVTRGGGSGGNAIFANENSVNQSVGNTVTALGFTDISFLNDFKLSLNINVYNNEYRRHNYESAYVQSFGSSNTNGYVYQGQTRNFSYNLQQLLNYNKTIDNMHNINVLLGHEYYDTHYSYVDGAKTNIAFDGNQSLAGAVTMNGLPYSMSTRYNVEGYFLRGMYDYNNKYFTSISFRHDASSRFHPDNRWGNFWSIGGAWIISKEDWYDWNWLQELKVKASVGSQGNDNIGSYLYDDQYDISANGNDEVSLSFKQKGNKNITWETNTNYNAGIEFTALKGRISGSLDYYYRLTSDMLYKFTVAPSNGYTSYWDNIGDMRNMGVEFDVNVDIIREKDFNWGFNFNIATLSNKIIKLPKEKQTLISGKYSGYADDDARFVSLYRYFIAEDLPLFSYYIPEYAGVNENGEAMWYKDIVDESGKITGRETTVKSSEATDYIHGSSLPNMYGGFGTSLRFRNFDFSANFNYSIGGVVYDYGYASLLSAPSASSSGNFHKDIYQSWSPTNRDSFMPRFQAGETNSQNARSDRFLTNASFLNFQNMNIGYTFPASLMQKINIKNLRIYFQCENIAYLSARRGFDSRQAGSNGRVNPQSYSPVRSISMGINLNF